jgi:hypothetical protein
MAYVIQLPQELERSVVSAAKRRNISVEAYLQELVAQGLEDEAQASLPQTGKELLQRLREIGFAGSWSDRVDIPDSPVYARQLREEAQHRAEE